MESIIFPSNQGMQSLVHCLILSVGYVGSLYVGKSPHVRDHPQTIKQRMRSVIVVCILAPFYLFYFCITNDKTGNKLNIWLGIYFDYLLMSTMVPLVLTIILFLGPLTLLYAQNGLKVGVNTIIDSIKCRNLIFYRTYIVAPFTEEFIFRACLLPLLIPNFGVNKSILIAPLFFGVAHFHHIIEQLKIGHPIVPVIITSMFQMFYTTIFGAYTAFLFLRTGHLAGPVVCHSFCNMMGFPEFESISTCGYPKLVWLSFVLGLVIFLYLLYPFTDPLLYGGSIYQY